MSDKSKTIADSTRRFYRPILTATAGASVVLGMVAAASTLTAAQAQTVILGTVLWALTGWFVAALVARVVGWLSSRPRARRAGLYGALGGAALVCSLGVALAWPTLFLVLLGLYLLAALGAAVAGVARLVHRVVS